MNCDSRRTFAELLSRHLSGCFSRPGPVGSQDKSARREFRDGSAPKPPFSILDSFDCRFVGVPRPEDETWRAFFVRVYGYRTVMLHNNDDTGMLDVVVRLQVVLGITTHTARTLMLAAHSQSRVALFHGSVSSFFSFFI